jgi:hypothetical protein
MKQREHAVLIIGWCLKNPDRPGANLPNRADQATCVLAFFAIAAAGRIGEKNPGFSRLSHHNGPDHDV